MVKRIGAVAVTALLTAGTLSACVIERESDGLTGSSSEQDSAQPAQLPTVSVKDGATDVDPSVPVTVTAGENGLAEVEMVNENDKVVDSEFSDDKSSWATTEDLGYNRTYTVTATDDEGESVTASFSTATPTTTSSVALSPIEDSTVGVAQTIAFRFASTIDDRQAAQDAITITTSPEVEGAFYWLNNSEVRWRPEEFWDPGTTVTVDADIYGVDLGDGVYGANDNATSFTVGDEVTTVVDDATKTMTVSRDGEVLRTIPVSLGTDKWATPNGTYIIGDQYDSLLMDSETYGLDHEDGGYSTEVDYATQMSYSGIFVHAAPWSVSQQGVSNASHGCVNVTTEAASWFQSVVKRGDPVVVKNTSGETLSGYDGLGDWNIPWSTWSAGNADETSAW
ncbi:transpeptidase [Corynebacterium alimapuense]|uniref:Transpeptidase n=1 Tax=Corynebacterium alimapuense TaxID=1576874 RepID=A0A3M8K941_9CORY|nr:transpeptidase [Corynebacterium alimapuense]